MSFQICLAAGTGAGVRAGRVGSIPFPLAVSAQGGWQQTPSNEFTEVDGWGQISCGFGGLSRALLGWSVQPHEGGYQLMYKMAMELW